MSLPDVNTSTRPIPGVADAETDALMDALTAYQDLVSENHEILSDDWQTYAMQREQEHAAAELRERGAIDDNRPSIVDEWRRERPRLLAKLEVMRDEIHRLDRKAHAAIRKAAPAENGPAVERVRVALDEYDAAITALARSAAAVKTAVGHAHTVQTLIRTGSNPRDMGGFAGGVFAGREDAAIYEARESLQNARQRTRHILNGGVRYLPGQAVVFSLPGGITVERTLTAEGAERLNANDLDSARLLLTLDASAVPVLGGERAGLQ